MSYLYFKKRIRKDKNLIRWVRVNNKVISSKNDRDTPKTEPIKRREMVTTTTPQEVYEIGEVERILLKHKINGVTWWLIKWVGHDITKATFENVLDGCKESLADFKNVENMITFEMTDAHVDRVKEQKQIFKLERIVRKKKYGTQLVIKWEGIPLTTTEDYSFMDKTYPKEVEEFEKMLEDEGITTGKKRKRKFNKKKKHDHFSFDQSYSFLEGFLPTRKQRKRKAKKRTMLKKTFSSEAKRRSEIKVYYERDCMLN